MPQSEIALNLAKCEEAVIIKIYLGEFPGCPVVKNPPSNAGDAGSIPRSGKKDPTCSGATKTHELQLEKTKCCSEDAAQSK